MLPMEILFGVMKKWTLNRAVYQEKERFQVKYLSSLHRCVHFQNLTNPFFGADTEGQNVLYCQNWLNSLSGRQSGGTYVPPSLDGSVISPGYEGGINWGGCSANTQSNTITCVVKNDLFAGKLYPQNADVDNWCKDIYSQSDTPYKYCSAPMRSNEGYPCIAPPWTELIRVDANTGGVVWRQPLGYVPNSNYSTVWGSIGQAGGVTETLGGVIFVTGTSDRNLWGFDAATGRQLFSAQLPWTAYTTPITYQIKGTQFVTVFTTNDTNGAIMSWTVPNPSPEAVMWPAYLGGILGTIILLTCIIAGVIILYKKRTAYKIIK